MTGYYLAHLFEEEPVGTVNSGPPWPQHVTLVADFDIALSAEQLVELLDPLLRQLPAATTTVLYPDFFGAERDMEVRLLEPTNSLLDLHFQPIDLMKEHGQLALRNPRYAGFAYRPHLSVQPGLPTPEQGQQLVIDSITLHQIEPRDDSRSVVHTWRLQPGRRR